MSLNFIEIDRDCNTKAILKSQGSIGRLAEITAAADDSKATYERWHTKATLSELSGQSNATAASLQELRAESKRQDQALAALLVQRGESEVALINLRADEESATVALNLCREELARTEEKLGINLNECTEATAQLADLGRTVTELEDREAAAAQKIQQYTSELVAQTDRLLQTEGQISAMELALAALGEQHCLLGEEIVVLVNTRQSSADALQTCRTDLTATEQILQTTREDCLAAETYLSSLSQSIQERKEEEFMLGERINLLQQQAQQLDTQTQEQRRVLEIVQKQRIEAEISLQCVNQQHEEVGIRLESGQAEIAAAAARLQQTLEQCQHADERKQSLDHELENIATRQCTLEAILGEVEAQISRRKNEREFSIAAADQAREEHAILSTSVSSVRKELSLQLANVTEATSKLSELHANLHDTEGSLNATRAILAGEELKLEATRSALATLAQELSLAHEIEVSLEALSTNQAKVASIELHIDTLTRQVAATAERRTQMDAILNDTTHQLVIATSQCDAISQQETETRQRLAQLGQQEKELRKEIDILTTSAQKERGIYNELRSINTETRQIQEQENAEIATKRRITSMHIARWQGQLASLQASHERMNLCLTRQQEVEPESLEARNLNQEIHMALAGLRYIMERLSITKDEIDALPALSPTGCACAEGVSAVE
jgi:chromosome segregation ATPase